MNRTILEDLEARILALRDLHAKLRDAEGGSLFRRGRGAVATDCVTVRVRCITGDFAHSERDACESL